MFFKNERGQALVVVFLMVAVIFLVGAAVIELGLSVKKNAISEVAQQKAYYIDEAGVNLALADLRQRAFTSDQALDDFSISNRPYADGQIDSVTVSATAKEGEIGTLFTITAAGSYMKAKKTLNVTVLVTGMADVFHGLSVLPESACNVDADVVGNFTLLPAGQSKRPRMIINGDITFGSNAGDINAVVFASGEINDKHNRVNSKDKYPNYSSIPPFPGLPSPDWFQSYAQCFSGDTTVAEQRDHGGQMQNFLDIKSLQPSGIYLIDGNVTISGTYSVPATIVATGGIKIGDLRRTDRNNGLLLTLIAGEDVEINGSNEIDAIIVAGGSYCAKGKSELYGSLVTRNLDNGKISGKTEIIVDPELVERSLQGFLQKLRDTSALPEEPYPILTIRSWQGG